MTGTPRILALEEAAAALARGGIVLLQTDTLPGLHCRADDAAAVARLAALKGRAAAHPFLVLAASLEQARRVTGPLDDLAAAWCAACWPGPFSLILPAAAGLPAGVTDGGRTVAVRVPAPAPLRRLLTGAGGPVASTSVNLSGAAACTGFAAAVAAFGARVQGCWNFTPDAADAADAAAPPRPSALVDLSVRPPRLLREGPLPLPSGLPPRP